MFQTFQLGWRSDSTPFPGRSCLHQISSCALVAGRWREQVSPHWLAAALRSISTRMAAGVFIQPNINTPHPQVAPFYSPHLISAHQGRQMRARVCACIVWRQYIAALWWALHYSCCKSDKRGGDVAWSKKINLQHHCVSNKTRMLILDVVSICWLTIGCYWRSRVGLLSSWVTLSFFPFF